MKKILLFYSVFVLILVTALLYSGCSKLDTKNAVTAPDIGGVHAAGWTNPASSNFHGKYIHDNNLWNLNTCKTCHGADYRGGNTGLTCFKCHTSEQGPEECTTCHGGEGHVNPPKDLHGDTLESIGGVGMHMSHLFRTDFAQPVECIQCHAAVNSFTDTTHFGAAPTGEATMTFGPLARHIDTHGVTPNPSFDRNTLYCSNVYCHGKFFGGNQNNTPKWNDDATVFCGTCHGDPATENPNPAPSYPHISYYDGKCYWCHSSMIDSTMTIIHPERHVNGVVDFNVNNAPFRTK